MVLEARSRQSVALGQNSAVSRSSWWLLAFLASLVTSLPLSSHCLLLISLCQSSLCRSYKDTWDYISGPP